MLEIEITEPAKADIQEAFDWWKSNRDPERAARWYQRAFDAISTLRVMPTRCPHVPERDLSENDVRHLWFGIGRSVTHRIVFVVREKTVSVLRVRHHAQATLDRVDLE